MTLSVRGAFALSLWLAAAGVVGIILIGRSDPVGLVRWWASAHELLRAAGLWLLVGGGIALIAYPPALPWLRLRWIRLRQRLSVDQRTLRELEERLRHFETAADHLQLGRMWLRHGVPARALPHLVRAQQLDPEHLGTLDELGRALLHHGHPRHALPALRHVHAAQPEFAFGATAVALGEALLRNDEPHEAASVLERLTRTYPGNRRALWFLAQAKRRTGDASGARDALQRAAAPAEQGTRLSPEDRYFRARARVALWRVRG